MNTTPDKEGHVKKVLIVEDDRAISKAIALRLQANGFKPLQAFDAVTATMLAKQQAPDLAILDINMPGGDGFLVADRLRTITQSEFPLIFLTASREAGLCEKAAAMGASAFFNKPYSGDALVAAVRDAATTQAA